LIVQVIFAILKEQKKADADRKREWVPLHGSGTPSIGKSAYEGLGDQYSEES